MSTVWRKGGSGGQEDELKGSPWDGWSELAELVGPSPIDLEVWDKRDGVRPRFTRCQGTLRDGRLAIKVCDALNSRWSLGLWVEPVNV